MRFLPYRSASIDQAPGPIIANADAKIAGPRATHGSPECEENREIAIHTLAAAASTPASGVNMPTNRSTAAAIPITCRATVNGGGPSRMLLIPKRISAAPVSKRRRRRPAPGHPSAKVENSRCTISHLENREFTKESTDPKLGWRDTPFGGSKLDNSASYRGSDCVSPVVGVELREYICDVAFHGLLGNAKFVCDLFVGIAGCDQSQHLDLA
jgi:hypothetical protein